MKLIGKFFIFIGWVLSISIVLRAADVPLQISESTRTAMFDRVVAEMERLDGEGLPPRMNRPESWEKTISRLRLELKSAKTKFEVGQVFRRLDATYPNLHAQVTLDPTFDLEAGRVRPIIAARFRAEIVNKGQKSFKYLISSLDKDLALIFKEQERPGLGDEVIEINGKPTRDWSNQNFLFCKLPMREQCEANFFDHFRKELIGWDRSQPLSYKLRRNGREWSVNIPFKIPEPLNSQSNSSAAEDECAVASDRYDGFKPVLKGFNICVFESEKWPNVSVLRIASFAYRGLPKEQQIQSLKEEVDRFYNEYWKAKAPTTKKIIIDVMSNGGGDNPVRWYQVFLDKPFQEQYVQFKKLPEIEDPEIRKEMFYADPGHELWFDKIKQNGSYAKTPLGSFLPTQPAFCADETKSCDESFYEPLQHGFKGKVDILVDEYCISSCTGFVWQFRDKLKSRVKLLGFPDSGDSAYARLFLDVYLTSDSPGYRVSISPRQGRTMQRLPEGAMLRQQVTVTRSTDAKGRIISAIPMIPDVWVPNRYHHFDDTWEATVFKEALKQ